MSPTTAFLSTVPLGTNRQCTGATLQNATLKRPRRPSKCSPERHVHSYQCGRPVATIIKPETNFSDSDLESFSTAVEGEWPGYEGNFNSTTAAVNDVHESYIPEQFEEWGLKPRGFETNHSVIVRGDKLYRKFFRILPSVSLFGDHVDLEEEFNMTPLTSQGTDESLAIFPDGSFVTSKAKVTAVRTSKLDKYPSVSFSVQDARKTQRRCLNIWVCFDFEEQKFFKDIRVIIEKHNGDYCDGADMEGSSGFVEGWTSGKAGEPAQLKGEWVVHTASSIDPEDDASMSGEAIVLRGDDVGDHVALFLPGGVDLAIKEDTSGIGEGALLVQAGWLVDADTRVVLRRSFRAEGTVAYSQRLVERRLS